MLRDLKLRPVYDSSDCDLVNDLIVPLLSESTSYWRGVGFFTSGWLRTACKGVVQLLENAGKARIITSPILQPSDWDAFQLGDEAKSNRILTDILRNHVDDLSKALSHDTLNALAWMVAEELIEFRFAIPREKNMGGAYHDKVGVFSDSNGDIVAIHGSFNDSARGSLNGEAFSVFMSWDEGQIPYVNQHFSRLKKLWSQGNSQFRTVLLPEAIRDELISKRSFPKPYCRSIDTDHEPRNPDSISEIKLRDYQKEAISKWQQNGCRGIFEMATGTGKTYTALAAATLEFENREQLAIVILVPLLHLLDQWRKNSEQFGFMPILCSGSHGNWNRELRSKIQDFRIGLLPKLCIIAVQPTAASNRFTNLLNGLPSKSTMLVADEVHRLGSADLQNALLPNAGLRLGLSATPYRWYDEKGTAVLLSYFSGICFEFTLEQAIGPFLTPYRYHPILVHLTESERDEYEGLSMKIAILISKMKEHKPDDKKKLESLLRERSYLITQAEGKLPQLISLLRTKLKKLEETREEMRDVLIYCAPGKHKEVLSSVASLGLRCHEFVHTVSLKDRVDVLKQFSNGDIQVLIAIKCLDEGVDIPSTKVAYFLSSTTNPKEFIQRRGRILRKFEGKDSSDVFDFIVVPDMQIAGVHSNTDLSILKREMPRFAEFAESATNQFEARSKILNTLELYHVLHFVDMKPWDIYHDVMESLEIKDRS